MIPVFAPYNLWINSIMKLTPKLIKYPNKILTVPTVGWDFTTSKREYLVDMAKNMEELLKTKPDGIALAANQAGYTARVFVVADKFASEYSIPNTIVNPRLNPVGPRLIEEREGCLSFPGLYFPVKRHDIISCDFYDVEGVKRIVILEDFAARVFQHECEHLDGKLYVDNLPKRERYQVLGKFKNRGY